MYDYINGIVQCISAAQRVNFEKWNILNINVNVEYITLGTWENEVNYIKDFLMKRVEYLDKTEVENW